jgi:hypothetical protein
MPKRKAIEPIEPVPRGPDIIISGANPLKKKKMADSLMTSSQRKKKRKMQEPRPKRVSAYHLFLKDKRPAIVAANPELKFTDTIKKVAALWNSCSQQEKSKFQARARAESRKLEQEFEEEKRKRFEEKRAERMRQISKRAKEKGANAKKKKKSKSSMETDWDWRTCWNRNLRKGAVLKGIDCIRKLAEVKENFDYFGNDIIQCFFDVANVTGEPIRQRCLMFLDELARRWKRETTENGWIADPEKGSTAQEVIDVVIGMYCLERIGLSHGFKEGALKEAAAFSAMNFYSWDPETEATVPTEQIPDKCQHCGESNHERTKKMCGGCGKKLVLMSKYRALSNALINSFFAYKAGVTLGCDFPKIITHLPEMRPYKGHDLCASWEDYNDQCYLVTHVIYVLSNWGELTLDKNAFPHEYFFIIRNLPIHMHTGDIHLISEFIECLRIFGAPDSNERIKEGINFLLENQNADGSWDSSAGSDPYTVYHATMCACQAMLAHRYGGPGPGIVEVAPLLDEWHKNDVQASIEYEARETETRGDDVEEFTELVLKCIKARDKTVSAELAREDAESQKERQRKKKITAHLVGVKQALEKESKKAGAAEKKASGGGGGKSKTNSIGTKVVPGSDFTTGAASNKGGVTDFTAVRTGKKKAKKSAGKKAAAKKSTPAVSKEDLLKLKQFAATAKKMCKQSLDDSLGSAAFKKAKKSLKKILKEIASMRSTLPPDALKMAKLSGTLNKLANHPSDADIKKWAAGVKRMFET